MWKFRGKGKKEDVIEGLAKRGEPEARSGKKNAEKKRVSLGKQSEQLTKEMVRRFCREIELTSEGGGRILTGGGGRNVKNAIRSKKSFV